MNSNQIYIHKNALSKDFTPFYDENCKNRTQAIVNENVVCTFYILGLLHITI